ncbi:TPA: DUF2971 domain-containing protein [Escherichia coli]|nr:DUF2971 domain-containing protein [Escherichia coli]HAO1155331.1 DUF2971 domain-containing protein [Escherichia coli]
MNKFQISPNLKPETKLWRYMSLDKFIDILSREELYFSPLSSYSNSDPYEGLLPKVALNAWASIVKSKFNDIQSYFNDTVERIRANELLGRISNEKAETEITKLQTMMDTQLPKIESIYFKILNSVTVNCWHQNEHESEGMWRLYSDANKGIAIQTSISRLIDSLQSEEIISISEVKYIDYFDEKLTSEDCVVNGRMVPFLKRKAFSHENEVRLSITPKIINSDIENYTPKGIRIKTDPVKLIEKIYISPYASQPYPSAVAAILEKFNIDNNKLVISNLLTIDHNLLRLF